MAGTDGLGLAEDLYGSMFFRREPNMPHHERSAQTLQVKTRKAEKNGWGLFFRALIGVLRLVVESFYGTHNV